MYKKEELKLTEPVADRLVVIGDVHGLTSWRDVVVSHPDARFVFLGDYCDSYRTETSAPTDEEVIDNFIDMIDFKKQYPERVTLLLGNHDLHYLLPDIPKCTRYNLGLSMMLNDLFEGNASLFERVYACNRLIFTHAGVLRSWFVDDFGGDLSLPVDQQIKACEDPYLLMQCSYVRGGLSNHGGIYWADKDEFLKAELLPGYIQIAGHNRVRSIKVIGDSATTGHLIFCDSLYRDNYLVIDHPSAEQPEFYAASINKTIKLASLEKSIAF